MTTSSAHETESPSDLVGLILPRTDPTFTGYYLDIETTMKRLGVSRLEAHEIQNFMRDTVEERSGSYSPLAQKTFLRQALAEAVERVTRERASGSGFSQRVYAEREFVLALDLEGTLLQQWYRYGAGVGTFAVEPPDVLPSFVDRETGDSRPSAELLVSGGHVQMRPGVREFMRRVAGLPGFAGFVIFTTKADAAALAVHKRWRELDPEAMSRVVGVFARNHLRFDDELPVPAKDLRLVDPTLEHVFLIDNDEERVMQRDLTYRVPRFDADRYLASTMGDGDSPVRTLNEAVLPYLAAALESCVLRAQTAGGNPTRCFRDDLGRLGEAGPDAELEAFLAFARKAHRLDVTVARAHELALFDPVFHAAARRPATERYPRFKRFRMQDREEIRP